MILATDLDRTLFPNGAQPADDSMPRLADFIARRGITLVYVTGRNLQQIREGIGEFAPPLPAYAVAEVGTRVYRRDDERFSEDTGYLARIRDLDPQWSADKLRRALADCRLLRLQEDFNQNEFKLSYYVDDPGRVNDAKAAAGAALGEHRDCAQIITSVDETVGIGLLDILPRHANKLEGIEFVRGQLGAASDDIVYAGDSGNDLIPLTSGYRAVVVGNASDEVRREVERSARRNGTLERIHFAGGYYHAGILEALELLDEGTASPRRD